MSLRDYAENELRLAGLFDDTSDYGGMIGDAVLELVDTFAKQGHSGMSASIVTAVFEKVVRYEPLTPLSYGEDQWIDQSGASGKPMWQHKRDFKVFSEDGGKTHYRLDS